MDINAFNPYAYAGAGTRTGTTTDKTDKTDPSDRADAPYTPPARGTNQGLKVDDFLKLLASQLQNQDMMNPMKDTEFMGQLAQFTMLQSVDDMKAYVTNSAEVNATAYAMGLVGKNATAATLDKDGNMEKITGVITGVTLYEGQPVFYINGKGFYLSQLMVVGEVPKDPETGDPSHPIVPPTDGSGDGGSGEPSHPIVPPTDGSGDGGSGDADS